MSNPVPEYIGRFAPSPTGPMHLGTLVAAMASYLEAKQKQGQWLLRIEDLDPPREVPGSADAIIKSLEKLGFEWDQSILYQSNRNDAYQETVNWLLDQKLAYACDCSRKTIVQSRKNQTGQHKSGELVYSGFCRNRHLATDGEVAIRVITESKPVNFTDQLMGHISINPQKQSGDFVIQRKDKLFAYQLAVVIDDAFQNVTDVVRGADLLDSTPRQIHLQRLLGMDTPNYFHIPLLLDKQGEKYSKSSFKGESPENNLNSLVKSWHHLKQLETSAEEFDQLDDFWHWAINNWDIKRMTQYD